MSSITDRNLWTSTCTRDGSLAVAVLDLAVLSKDVLNEIVQLGGVFENAEGDIDDYVLLVRPVSQVGQSSCPAIKVHKVTRVMERSFGDFHVVCDGDTAEQSNIPVFGKAELIHKMEFLKEYDGTPIGYSDEDCLDILGEDYTNVINNTHRKTENNNINKDTKDYSINTYKIDKDYKKENMMDKLCKVLNIQFSLGELTSFDRSADELVISSAVAKASIKGDNDINIKFDSLDGESKIVNSNDLKCFGTDSVPALTKRIIRALKSGDVRLLESSTNLTHKQVINKLATTLEHNKEIKVTRTDDYRLDIDGKNTKSKKYVIIDSNYESEASDSIHIAFMHEGNEISGSDLHIQNEKFETIIGIVLSYFVNDKMQLTVSNGLDSIETILNDIAASTHICRISKEEVGNRLALLITKETNDQTDRVYDINPSIYQYDSNLEFCVVTRKGHTLYDEIIPSTSSYTTCDYILRLLEFIQ